jgi:hypothetical protein
MVVKLIIFNLNSRFLELTKSCARLTSLYFLERCISKYEIAKATRDTNNGIGDKELVCMTYPANSGMLPQDIANHTLL